MLVMFGTVKCTKCNNAYIKDGYRPTDMDVFCRERLCARKSLKWLNTWRYSASLIHIHCRGGYAFVMEMV